MISRYFPVGVFVLFAVGCGAASSRPVAEMKGTVQFEGRTVPGGTVLLLSEDGQFSTTVDIDEEGRFQTAGAPVGNAKAAIIVPVQPSRAAPKNSRAKKSKAAMVTKLEEGEAELPEVFSAIPLKYRDPQKSGLTFPVVEGTNEWTILLKKK